MRWTRQACVALDADDVLGELRGLFILPEGRIYLDGNSLGPLPAAVPGVLQRVATQEWGEDLISSWNTHEWLQLPQRVGDKIARLVGAGPGELIVTDSTSINLAKVVSAALSLARDRSPHRTEIVSERTNFPSDLYVAEGVVRMAGASLRLVHLDPAGGISAAVSDVVSDDTAVVLLTQVDYRTGRMLDLAEVTAAVHRSGALMVWDLAHSAGAVPVDLHAADADFAVGCGYKYLNGGPGAPSFVWMHPRWAAAARQPLQGWLGHEQPFAFDAGYRPAPGILGFQAGTPPILSLAALECGVDTVLAAEPFGGVAALRAKSTALTSMFIDLVDERCPILRTVSPRAAAERGSQIALTGDVDAYALVQALVDRGVTGDFRAPEVARFGFAPLYIRFVDVWDAVDRLAEVIDSEAWREPRFAQRAPVT
ncbi:MAG: kynureninase [Ilumatobacteraceae bacterium]|nr:kynureninase [Ilumatobacteraceae bacterium]